MPAIYSAAEQVEIKSDRDGKINPQFFRNFQIEQI